MRFAIVFSVLLHVGGFMLAYVALPEFRSNPIVEIIVPIELISEAELAEETSVPETVMETEVEAEPEPLPEPEPVQPEPEPVTPEPEPEAVPPLPEPEPEPEKPEPKPEPKKPEPQKPEPKNEELDLDFLEDALKDLNPDKDKAAPREVPSEVPTSDRNQQRVGLGDKLTASEITKIRAKMRLCWNTQAFIGAPEPEKLIVEVEFKLNRDGSLLGQPNILNRGQIQSSGNPFWVVAQRNAVTAVLDCAPYDFLPDDRYDVWQEVKLTFNPAQMAGF